MVVSLILAHASLHAASLVFNMAKTTKQLTDKAVAVKVVLTVSYPSVVALAAFIKILEAILEENTTFKKKVVVIV